MTSSTGTGSQHLRVGCLNIRGLKVNTYYTHQLLNQHDIFAISEHWLQIYELQSLQALHPDFNFLSSAPPAEEDDLYCRPRYLRGHGRVAITWRKSLIQHVSKLDNSSSHRVVGISLQAQPRPICLLSVYLPMRTGCTDIFKESLDYLDSMINLLGYENDVFILGDMNADLGLSGGPMASTPINEQGKILRQYLQRWNFLSAHLHLSPTPATSTYESEARAMAPYQQLTTFFALPMYSHLSYPAVSSKRNHASNNSDHLPITCQISTHHPNSPIFYKKSSPPPRPNWRKLTTHDLQRSYTSPLEVSLSHLPFLSLLDYSSNPHLIDRTLSNLISLMKSTADANIPSKRFSPHQTPEWDDELKRAQKAANNAHKAWRNAGKPRNPDHPLRITYKDSKRKFRAKLRNHCKNLRELFFSKLDLANTDSRKLFSEIRNINGHSPEPSRVISVNGTTFQGDTLLEG